MLSTPMLSHPIISEAPAAFGFICEMAYHTHSRVLRRKREIPGKTASVQAPVNSCGSFGKILKLKLLAALGVWKTPQKSINPSMLQDERREADALCTYHSTGADPDAVSSRTAHVRRTLLCPDSRPRTQRRARRKGRERGTWATRKSGSTRGDRTSWS
ncbi:hypothetical protein J4Q44_G00247810 [Coregonus suidteri]|uniref:Uncharacterized protein n=1 Tax=Coregonus suidteri TaxID=861788 RepID=A0AAN8LDJ2_9TELE